MTSRSSKLNKFSLKYVFYTVLIGLWGLSRNYPTLTERLYSKGIYPNIAKVEHFLLGWISFSMGDVFYTLFFAYIIYLFVKNIKYLWQKPLLWLDKTLLLLMSTACAFFFLWGFNYFRVPLATTLGVETTYTEEELYSATEHCLQRAIALHQQLAPNDSVKVDFNLSNKEIYALAHKAYPLGITGISDFSSCKSVKSSLYSTLLTYMGYSGYLNPFTNESQVNGKMVGYSKPITACHEIAHQMGYAAEEEANYLGYLAAEKADSPYFKYSAELFALRHFLNEIAVVNPEKYKEIGIKIPQGILENYREVRRFWQQYENKAEPVFKASYDAFLKANKQQQGIDSYDLVVGLLIHHYTAP